MSTLVRDAQVSEYIHSNLYITKLFNRLASAIGGLNVRQSINRPRTTDYDVAIEMPDGLYKFKEKAQIKFINTPVPSFTLELYDTSRKKDGWFLTDNEDLVYIFIWILSADGTYDTVSYSDFNKLRLCFCKNVDLKKEIKYSADELRALAIRAKEENLSKLELEQGLMLCRSLKYSEIPINIKVPFNTLFKVSTLNIDLDCKTGNIIPITRW